MLNFSYSAHVKGVKPQSDSTQKSIKIHIRVYYSKYNEHKKLAYTHTKAGCTNIPDFNVKMLACSPSNVPLDLLSAVLMPDILSFIRTNVSNVGHKSGVRKS